jgi:single-strand DNA-binding protein
MLNQCNFIGRCGQDVEIRYTQAGDAVANVSIACTEKWKGQDGQQQEKTEWVSLVAFKRLAEIFGEFVQKGSLIYVSGKQQTRKWEDKEGVTRYTTEIVAREMRMIDSKGNTNKKEDYHQERQPQTDNSEVPF